MTLKDYSRLARQARTRMPRLSSAVAYAQMEQLMGRTGTSPARSVSGTNLEGSADTLVRSLEQRTKSPRSSRKRDTGCQPVDSVPPPCCAGTPLFGAGTQLLRGGTQPVCASAQSLCGAAKAVCRVPKAQSQPLWHIWVSFRAYPAGFGVGPSMERAGEARLLR